MSQARTAFFLTCGVHLLGILSVDGRAVNISNAWFLPQENFPLFYRYFKDKVTWDEAHGVCQSHRGKLVSVDSTKKMDALRAYLKELDVTMHVWLGLTKDAESNTFSWIHGEPIRGDGYWLEPIPKTSSRLCAATDPVADFRWSSYHCAGPESATFVCEQEVPDWAANEDGCMITELPSLSITLESEMNVIELTSDCGLAGTRRIACRGRINREEVIKHLSCDEDPFTDRSVTERMKDIRLTTKMIHKDTMTQTTEHWRLTSTERLTRHKRGVSPTSSASISRSLSSQSKGE